MSLPEIDDRFFNFAPETISAIREYRTTRNAALVPVVLQGIVDKYLPPHLRGNAVGTASLNAFGVESLTLMEIILDLQDALGITLTDDELRNLQSLEQATALLSRKVEALASAPHAP